MTQKPTLSQRIAQRIVQQALSERWAVSFHLVKSTLAEQFGVSRTPVQQALELLEQAGLVQQDHNRGFFLSGSAAALSQYLVELGVTTEPSDPQRIISDRLSGRLPEAPSEQELLRQYGWNKARLAEALRELASGGIVERNAGYGWQFQPLVTGLATQRFSYDFRRTIECAAISSPDYQIDKVLLEELRKEQFWLLEGGLDKVTHVEMFEIGSRFHEALLSGSSNPFFLDALRRANKLRSFYERSVPLAPRLFKEHCLEHIGILDSLLSGNRQQAVQLLHAHLGNVQKMKSGCSSEPAIDEAGPLTSLMVHF